LIRFYVREEIDANSAGELSPGTMQETAYYFIRLRITADQIKYFFYIIQDLPNPDGYYNFLG